MSTDKPKLGIVHWINAVGVKIIYIGVEEPIFTRMQDYIGGYIEHVSVLYNGAGASMYVHEDGRSLWADRNPTATEIYFAAARARGIDPEDKEQAKREVERMAERMGVPMDNIITTEEPEPVKPPGIYGPAVLLEGFKT